MISDRRVPVKIEDEMRVSYIDYAMSVIIGRAIPDVRDGLKPVHRRTLFAMWEMGNASDKPYKKSARVVGDVMGKYHPHGDAAIYDTLVKMAQDFSYRMPLVDGQGNFGSIDGDAAAAMRYTEVRLTKAAEELLQDLEKETVPFAPNFDESLREPLVLPSKIPNLLVNGTSGIAVGMATSMLPHNLGEACRAVTAYLDNPSVSVEELVRILPAPDFPTGGIIMGTSGIREAYVTGRGRCVVRGVAEITDEEKSPVILITEVPFQVNKARLVEEIAGLVKEKKIDGVSDIRDESDKDGIRVVVELRRGSMPAVVLNQLYKHTSLETSYGIIHYAIVDRQPKVLSLFDLLREFVQHRMSMVRKRTQFDLKKTEERVHVLKGLLLALASIDKVIATIRAAESAEKAREDLTARFALDMVQADAILKMQLRTLAGLERKKIQEEHDEGEREIRRLSEILSDDAHIRAEIRKEMVEIGQRFGDKRRTRIEGEAGDLTKEDLIEDRPMFISLTSENYIKRMALETYRKQHRGGRGIMGMATKEEDVVEDAFIANMHDSLLCFTNPGRVYWLKVYDIPEAARTAKGKPIVNLLNLKDERVTNVIPVRGFSDQHFVVFATKQGKVIKIPLAEFSRPRMTGLNALALREGDELVDVKVTDGSRELILTTKNGRSLRFDEQSVRPLHRGGMGVIGMRMRGQDALKALTVVEHDYLLTVTDAGYGKLTEFDEFRGHGRGTTGVLNIKTDRAGLGVVVAMAVAKADEIIVMSSSGNVMRTRVSEISIQKRNTRGVRIMNLEDGDRVVGVAIVRPEANGEDGGPSSASPASPPAGQP
ncbi:MAG TPA: DNA gyrase subunit A [Methanomicrobiales archaeon]|nr:DNA gyrase subunit A [Methanomicrobiales archaeon]